MKVGWVGLGQMGAPMAAHLVERPDGLVVCDVRADAMAPLVARGAVSADDVTGLVAAGASLISLMVVDDGQVQGIVDDLLALPRADVVGLVVAIHSTIGPDLAPALARRAARAGVTVIDAPVSGGVQGARTADLVVMVGAPHEVFERCRPVFESWSGLVLHTGEVGSGTRAKLARNLLQYVGFVAAHEAQQLAEAAGVDLGQLAAAVRHSDRITGGPSAVMVRATAAPMAPADPLVPIFGHVRDLAEKDLGLALGLARELGVDLPVSALAAASFARALGLPQT